MCKPWLTLALAYPSRSALFNMGVDGAFGFWCYGGATGPMDPSTERSRRGGAGAGGPAGVRGPPGRRGREKRPKRAVAIEFESVTCGCELVDQLFSVPRGSADPRADKGAKRGRKGLLPLHLSQ